MSRTKQKEDSHGSLKDIQLLVNHYSPLLNNQLKLSFKELVNDKINWKSPLANDDYAEYSDEDFIQKIGLDISETKLSDFWPSRGPQWDALATTNNEGIILVEAKANIPEIVSPPTSSGDVSKKLITRSLEETRDYLDASIQNDWSGTFYQYTNRIAHLYFLREVCKKPAFLANVYFVGDKSVKGPESIEAWQGAIQVSHSYFGLGRHKLSKYMADIFIHVDDLAGLT